MILVLRTASPAHCKCPPVWRGVCCPFWAWIQGVRLAQDLRNGVLRRFCLMLCLWGSLFTYGAAAQTLTYAQQLELLQQANQAFEQALASGSVQQARAFYQQAIAAYERLIAAGVHNARLYYNLGNAYCSLQDFGQAILQYRRGLRLEPGNERLRVNLSYARSRLTDAVATSHQPDLLDSLLFWRDDLTLQTQYHLALAGFLIAWASALAHVVWRRPTWLWWLVAAACLCLLCTASTVRTHLQHASTRSGVIMTDAVELRKGNGESYAPQLSQPLHRGTEFEVIEERGTWLAIRLANGQQGWLRREHVALL